jgi:hypothetical protein
MLTYKAEHVHLPITECFIPEDLNFGVLNRVHLRNFHEYYLLLNMQKKPNTSFSS